MCFCSTLQGFLPANAGPSVFLNYDVYVHVFLVYPLAASILSCKLKPPTGIRSFRLQRSDVLRVLAPQVAERYRRASWKDSHKIACLLAGHLLQHLQRMSG